MNKLESYDLDMLKEIANIGAGNAASALSDMTGQIVDISIPHCKLIGYNEIADYMGGADNVILGMLVQMTGDIEGYILMSQSLEDARHMIVSLLGQELPEGDVNIEDYEPMREVCNIVVGSYLSAIASMMNLSITPSVPEITVDMAMAIMNIPITVYGDIGDSVLLLDTQFDGDAKDIRGSFFLTPTIESLEVFENVLMGNV